MTTHTPLARFRLDLACGLSLLTRLPVLWLAPKSCHGQAWPMARSIWCWPLIGAGIGAVTGTTLALLMLAHVPPLAAACLALTVQTLLTGGLHEDGLADMADGCGASTPQRRLEIMRDSRVGSYGVMALCLSYGIRAGALLAFSPVMAPLACALAGGLARAAMLAIPAWLPPARTDGLAHALSPLPRRALLGAGLATLALYLSLGLALGAQPAVLVAPALAALVATYVVGRQTRRLLGGYTGDVLGCCAVVTDCLVLTALAALTG